MFFIGLRENQDLYIYDTDDNSLDRVAIDDFCEYLIETSSEVETTRLGSSRTMYECTHPEWYSQITVITDNNGCGVVNEPSQLLLAIDVNYYLDIVHVFDRVYRTNNIALLDTMYLSNTLSRASNAIMCDGRVLCISSPMYNYALCYKDNRLTVKDACGIELDFLTEDTDYVIEALSGNREALMGYLPFLSKPVRKKLLMKI